MKKKIYLKEKKFFSLPVFCWHKEQIDPDLSNLNFDIVFDE